MTDKEFKRLSRPELIDIIYQLQLRQEALTAENQKLKQQLEDRRMRIQEAGSIAEASLNIHNVLQAAQDAADQYLDEIRIMRAETEYACERVLEEARQEAAAIVAQATSNSTDYRFAVNAIMDEFIEEQPNYR